MNREELSRPAHQPESTIVTGGAQARSQEYHVAALPPEDVAKLRRVEEELAADTGQEIVVVAYEKEKAEATQPRS